MFKFEWHVHPRPVVDPSLRATCKHFGFLTSSPPEFDCRSHVWVIYAIRKKKIKNQEFSRSVCVCVSLLCYFSLFKNSFRFMSRCLFLIPSLRLQFNIILCYSSNTHASDVDSWQVWFTFLLSPPTRPSLRRPPPKMLHDSLDSGLADASPIPTPWSLGWKQTTQLPNENLSHQECWNSLQFSEQPKNSLKLSSLEIP
jgi:hypothetical protein